MRLQVFQFLFNMRQYRVLTFDKLFIKHVEFNLILKFELTQKKVLITQNELKLITSFLKCTIHI